MIAVHASDGAISLDGAPPGSIAYVDADWLVGGGAAPALLVHDGRAGWSGVPDRVPLGDWSADIVAGFVLASLASEAAAAAQDVPPELVRVPGKGLVARWIREELGRNGAETADRPRVVVDTTVGSASLLAATRSVAELGTIVLAGGVGERATAFDLYPDVHVRGLRLVSVAPRLSEALQTGEHMERRAELVGRTARSVRPGEVVQAGAELYRLES